MRAQVYNGTGPQSGISLCDTCRHAVTIRGRAYHEEIVRCHAEPMHVVAVTFKVATCTSYDDQRYPSYMQLLPQAWIFQPGGRKRRAGFVRSRDLDPEELDSIVMDGVER